MDLSAFEEDNSKNVVLQSNVPKQCKTEPCMLGIDEAGRGPVLGPMVYATAYCPIKCLDSLKSKGFADSKTLTEEKRENLFSVIEEVNDMMGWILEIHSPNVISNCMLRRCKHNLNALSHDSAIMLIKNALEKGVNVTEAYIDTVGPPDKYQAKLSSIFPEIKITVAKQADSTFPIVSAASICAKVARDNALKKWKFTEGGDFKDVEYGSGYPNDPATKKFLTEHVDPVFGFTQLVRFSWSTAVKVMEEKCVKILWGDEDDDDTTNENSKSKTTTLFQFMKKRKKSYVKKPKSHTFFTRRHLTQAVEL